jgi:hypothetical protein
MREQLQIAQLGYAFKITSVTLINGCPLGRRIGRSDADHYLGNRLPLSILISC